MRVRVELRRQAGRFIPRFRPQAGFVGQLVAIRQKVQDREVRCLRVECEPRQGYPGERVIGPVLYDVKIGDVMLVENGLELIGFEVVDGAIHLQEWDCFFL